MLAPPRRASQTRRQKRAASLRVPGHRVHSDSDGEEDLLGILDATDPPRKSRPRSVSTPQERRVPRTRSPGGRSISPGRTSSPARAGSPTRSSSPGHGNELLSVSPRMTTHKSPKSNPHPRRSRQRKNSRQRGSSVGHENEDQSELDSNYLSPKAPNPHRKRSPGSSSKRKGRSRRVSSPDPLKPSPPHSAPPPFSSTPPKNSGQSPQVDALRRMKQGTSLLKYGRFGYPHFRQFQISTDASKLIWFSDGKSLNKTSIMLADVDRLVKGQTTECFKRHPQPQMESLSFSLIYSDGQKTLDLCCKTVSDYEVWTQGLQFLIGHSKQRFSITGADELKELMLDVDTSVATHRERIRSNSRGLGLSIMEGVTRESLDEELVDLRKKLGKLQKFCKKVGESPQMTESMDALRHEIDAINDTIDNDDFAVAKHDIWRLGVEIDTLKSAWHHYLQNTK